MFDARAPQLRTMQYTATLPLCRIEMTRRLRESGRLLGALLFEDAIELDWVLRVRDARSELLALARTAEMPMTQHPVAWLAELLPRVDQAWRLVGDTARARAVPRDGAQMQVEAVLALLEELRLMLIALIKAMAHPQVAAGGFA